MTWSGDVVFGPAWAAYRGPAADNTAHAHAALQLVFGMDGPVQLQAEDGSRVGPGFLIKQAVAHAILSRGPVGLVYLAPQSSLGRRLLVDMRGADVAELAPDLLVGLDPAGAPETWLRSLEAAFGGPSAPCDARVEDVLRRLSAEPDIPIALAAREAGLSASRLRELVRAHLGVPLSTWLVWRKLEVASRAIARGQGLAEAALSGGFADQAHCARAMRRMFGITAGMARAALV